MIWHFWKKDKSGLFKNKNIFSSWKSWYNPARWKTNFHILFYSTLAKKKQLKTYLVLFWDNAEYLGLYLACNFCFLSFFYSRALFIMSKMVPLETTSLEGCFSQCLCRRWSFLLCLQGKSVIFGLRVHLQACIHKDTNINIFHPKKRL